MNSKSMLITGASGLIGSRLTDILLDKGYHVCHLSRSRNGSEKVKTYLWDVKRFTIEPEALHDIDAIVHLAGAGIAEKRWSEKRKREILESRTKSTALLHKEINKQEHRPSVFVSASGMSYYGLTLEQRLFKEDDNPGDDFIANVTKQWEAEADKISTLGVRTVKLRTSMVLARNDGALKAMALPVKFYVGAPLGSGEQMTSWIHIDDICNMYVKAIEDNTMHGAYNAAAPQPVTNRVLTKAIGKALGKPVFLPPIPAFVLKPMLGEMADMVVKGTALSVDKIVGTGFSFKFPQLDGALNDLL